MLIARFDWLGAALTALMVGGCQAPASPFRPVADMKQLMVSILEPAAEGYWDAVGSVDDERGTTYFAPRSGEEWEAVRNHAYLIAESGNLLLLEGRARGGDWIAFSQALIEAGRQAVAAAEARDTAAVFEAGGVVYESCARCHAGFAAQLVKPNERPE
jgi:hypothetical protein